MSELAWFDSLRRLNLNHLLTFMAVAEMRSFRAAANLLNISQSALSVQVRQLEQGLGTPLLHRTTRAVKLTEQGARLYAVSKRLSSEIAQVASDLIGEAALQSGVVTITVLPSLANTLLPKVMSEFGAQYPGIELKLYDSHSVRARELLRQGDVDIGVLARNEHLDSMDFVSLFEDEFLAVVPAEGHPLSASTSVSPADLAEHPMFLFPRGSDTRDLVETLFRSNGIIPRPAQELTASHPMVSLVGFGLGVCVLPRLSLQGFDLSRCRILRMKPFTAREIGIVSPRGRSEAPALIAFRRFLMANVSRLADHLGAPAVGS